MADLDGDGGRRADRRPPRAEPRGLEPTPGPGLYVYDPVAGTDPPEFEKHPIDVGGVAVEDAMAADLDGDGDLDLIAGGRATHNVRIYWNRGVDGDN